MQTSDFGKFTCRNHLKGSLVGILCSSFNLSSPPLIYFGFRIILKYYLFFFFKHLIFWWFFQFYFLLVDLIIYVIIFGFVLWIRKRKKDKRTSFSRINHSIDKTKQKQNKRAVC